jgi:LysM repeat protein
MQRDMKIGMALGLALVGIVGALFFRREPEVSGDKTPPPLENAAQIDKEIAEQVKAPYIQGIEDTDGTAAPVPPPAAGVKPNTKNRNSKPGFTDEGNSQETAAGIPIGTPGSRADNADASPAHNADWEPRGPSGPTGKKGGETRGNPSGSLTGTGRTHVIKSGDTLSGLAARYLGSSARFQEIYDANRDQLRSANDVREGMTLKIPDAGKPRAGQTATETAESARPAPSASKSKPVTKGRPASFQEIESDANDDEPAPRSAPPTEAPREKIRFIPVHRGPFSAGRVSQPDSK